MPAATKIAIAVVESDGHFLVGTRADDAPLAGKAEFPGGKCLPDETPRSCLVRECGEETGLMVIPGSHLATVTHEYDHDTVELHFWKCNLAPDLPDRASATEPFRWVSRSELSELNFPEANTQVLSLLLNTPEK